MQLLIPQKILEDAVKHNLKYADKLLKNEKINLIYIKEKISNMVVNLLIINNYCKSLKFAFNLNGTSKLVLRICTHL